MRQRLTLRHRRLSLQPCEPRLFLSAASAEETDWLWRHLETGFAEASELSAEMALLAESPTTMSQIDRPESLPLEAETSQWLDELTREGATDVDYLWSLRLQEVQDGQLPPTPWCDDEFRATLDELLLPVVGDRGSDWTLQVRGGFLPTSLEQTEGTRAWEASVAIRFGLNLDGPARFQADLVQILHPRDASDEAATRRIQGDFPMFYSTVSVSMKWSSLGQFWQYPLAYDLIDLVIDAPPDASSWGGVAFPSYGSFEDASAVSLVSYAETSDQLMRLAEFSSQTAISTAAASVSQTSVAHIDSISCDPHVATSYSWSVFSGRPDSQAGNDTAVNPISEARWDQKEGILEFGPQGLDFEPPQIGDSLDVEAPTFSKERSLESEDDSLLSGEELLSSPDENALHSSNGSSFVDDVAHAGFQRLLASDLNPEASTTGVVDLGVLASTEMIVMSTATARSVVARAPLPKAENDEAFGDANRTRVQEFVLVAATIGPDSSISSDTIGAPVEIDDVAEDGTTGPTPPAPHHMRPPIKGDPVSEVEAALPSACRPLTSRVAPDDLTARLHDAAMSSLVHLIRAPHESASAILVCVLGQLALHAEPPSTRDRPRCQRGPRLHA